MKHDFPQVVNSFKTFSEKIIDYAGIFPPASLSLSQSFHNYIFYSEGQYSWMLANFICPLRRLNEISELLKHLSDSKERIIPFSIISSGGNDFRNFKDNIKGDLEVMSEFLELYGNRVSINAIEVKLPSEVTDDKGAGKILDLMDELHYSVQETLKKEIRCFFEAENVMHFNDTIHKLVDSIAVHNLKKYSSGLKLRTGGTEAKAFPSIEEVAFTIIKSAEHNISLKFTAGLHHPVRHFDESVSAIMHGFMNIFFCGIFAHRNKINYSEMLQILGDEHEYNFDFDFNGLIWNNLTASEDEIKSARKNFVISFGSCSFEEPIDDLKAIELL